MCSRGCLTNNVQAVVWVGTFLAACFTALRTWLQYSHNRRFYINDYLILCALLVHVVLSILYQLIAPPMYELEPIINGFKTVDSSRLHYYNYYLRLPFAVTTLSWTTLWLVKLSLLTFFWRLFDSVRTHARLFWWVMCGITIATYIVSMFLQGFACLPLGSFYKFGKLQRSVSSELAATDRPLQGGCSSPHNVYRSVLTFHFSSITDIITDFFSKWRSPLVC